MLLPDATTVPPHHPSHPLHHQHHLSHPPHHAVAMARDRLPMPVVGAANTTADQLDSSTPLITPPHNHHGLPPPVPNTQQQQAADKAAFNIRPAPKDDDEEDLGEYAENTHSVKRHFMIA